MIISWRDDDISNAFPLFKIVRGCHSNIWISPEQIMRWLRSDENGSTFRILVRGKNRPKPLPLIFVEGVGWFGQTKQNGWSIICGIHHVVSLIWRVIDHPGVFSSPAILGTIRSKRDTRLCYCRELPILFLGEGHNTGLVGRSSTKNAFWLIVVTILSPNEESLTLRSSFRWRDPSWIENLLENRVIFYQVWEERLRVSLYHCNPVLLS